MATYGALNNSNISAARGNGTAVIGSLVMPEDGTITGVSIWMIDQGGSDQRRFGLFTGGASSSDPTGASLIWDSGLLDGDFSGSGEFLTEAVDDQAVSSGVRVWIVAQTDSSSQSASVASPDNGDMNLRTQFWLSGKGYLAGGFPSTAVAADGNYTTSQGLKAFITYTAGGGTTLTPAGIASAETFGTAVVAPGAVSVAPSGIASAEAFGSAAAAPGAVSVAPSAIASAEVFGSASIIPGAVTISPSGITGAEAFGTASLFSGVQILPAGIASAEAFGVLTMVPGAVTVQPSGIGTGEAFGALGVLPGSVILLPAGIAGAEAFGSDLVIPGAVVIAPAGLAGAEAFGGPVVTGGLQTLLPAGIATAEAFGAVVVVGGAAGVLALVEDLSLRSVTQRRVLVSVAADRRVVSV